MQIKILMVCLGNICRSPLAEGILKSKVNPDLVFVDSAGTGGYHIGESPDPRSIAIAKERGLDISGQRCRKFTPQDFEAYDIIYAMDNSNYRNIVSLAATEEAIKKVKLLLDEVNENISEVPDPYYGGDQGFLNVFNLIDRACDTIAKQLPNAYNNG